MALAKPILNAIPAWDVALGKTFTFSAIGGDQVVGATLYIANNATGVVVYTQTTTSFKYEVAVPPNVEELTNGTYYNAYLTTRDAQGNVSPVSNTIQFYCYSTPIWGFTNIAQGGTVTNSTFVPEVSYNQAQGELLNSYIITLYDASQTEIGTSGIQYISSSEVPITISYIFGGLEDNTTYYTKAIGQTVNNTIVETNFVRFTVQYTSPSAFSHFFLVNNCDEGYITYTSNSLLIYGVSYPDPPTYIDNDEVDLREADSWVKWTDGFVVTNNFTIKAWIRQPHDNTTLIILKNEKEENILIGYHITNDEDNKVYADLTIGEYYIYTPPIAKPSANQQLCLQVRRIANLYEIKMEVV